VSRLLSPDFGVQIDYAYFSFEGVFLKMGFRFGGSSIRASSALSGGLTLSVARVLFQIAVPRESCSTLPLGPLGLRRKSGRRIFTVSTMPLAPIARDSLFEPKTQTIHCPPTWSQYRTVLALGGCDASVTSWTTAVVRSPRRWSRAALTRRVLLAEALDEPLIGFDQEFATLRATAAMGFAQAGMVDARFKILPSRKCSSCTGRGTRPA